MIKILAMLLLVQLSNLYLFVKTAISSFDILPLNMSSLYDSAKNATKPTSLFSFSNLALFKHTEEEPGAATPSPKATGVAVPSIQTQTQTQPKANTTGKQRTKTRKSRYSILSKLNEIPNSPGVQCAAM